MDTSLTEKLDKIITILERLVPQQTLITIDWEKHFAFKWIRNYQGQGCLFPIASPNLINPNQLLNIDEQKSKLDANTAQFVQGLPANNVLLWGSRGTGKSSLVKAMLHKYHEQGLKLIEVDRDDLADLPWILQQISFSPYKFIIFCDDLSFETNDAAYKILKATLDGSLFAPTNNILIYATSNRRHLLPEFMHDNLNSTMDENGELHYSDALEEKISLSERFGLWISFYAFRQEDYLNIVQSWLQELGYQKWDDNIQQEALQFALHRGSRSGRVAYQFAKYHIGNASL